MNFLHIVESDATKIVATGTAPERRDHGEGGKSSAREWNLTPF